MSGVEYGVGDTLVYSETLGDYYKIDNTESVTSVNGHKGAVTLTKNDVGLSNVPNYAFTAAVNDASTVKFAAAGAVKQAYDLAASKITKAQGDSYYLGKTANAVSASKWAAARTLTLTGDAAGSVSMDGSANVSLAVTVNNAATGDKWTTARTLTLAGDVTGSVSMDGSANVSLTATVANNSHTHVLDNISDITKHVPSKVKDLDATDLNTLSSTAHAGFYRQTANASATTARHYPVAAAGVLLVLASAGGVVQMYVVYNTGALYTRGLYNNVWSAWRYSYDSVNKPTKADVGLNAVHDWVATSSVSDGSTTKYATAAAVKTAYDKAVAAFNNVSTVNSVSNTAFVVPTTVVENSKEALLYKVTVPSSSHETVVEFFGLKALRANGYLVIKLDGAVLLQNADFSKPLAAIAPANKESNVELYVKAEPYTNGTRQAQAAGYLPGGRAVCRKTKLA